MSREEATPLVVVGDDWGRHVSTLQHLFRQVLPSHPIVWVNSFGHRVPRLTAYDVRRAAAKVAAMLAPPPPPVHERAPDAVVHPRALPWHHVGPVHAANMRLLRHDVRRALDAVAPGRAPLLVSSTPIAEGLVGTLGERASVYFVIDDYATLPYVSAALVAPHERRMLDKVDLVVATARALVERKRPRSGRMHYLPQGVNHEHFATPRPVPPELAPLPRPILGFAGGVSECVDVPLLLSLADRMPGASIVLVGPVAIDPAALTRPNIHLLGNRPYADLPAYVQAFDVGLIPYVLNDWTLAVDPLKLLEYLAAGLPVVTTPLPEAAKYGQVIAIEPAGPRWLEAVAALAAEGPGARRSERQEVAGANTWRARAEAFMTLCEATVPAGATERFEALAAQEPDIL
jgi:glycosyltransferase involved in cell wall biosynthesis